LAKILLCLCLYKHCDLLFRQILYCDINIRISMCLRNSNLSTSWRGNVIFFVFDELQRCFSVTTRKIQQLLSPNFPICRDETLTVLIYSSATEVFEEPQVPPKCTNMLLSKGVKNETATLIWQDVIKSDHFNISNDIVYICYD